MIKNTFETQPKFPYTKPEFNEKWEQPIKIVNAPEQFGLPARQHVEEKELSPLDIIDIDDRALRDAQCASICFGRPHAGELATKELWQRAGINGKKLFTLSDRGTDDIFRSPKIPSAGTKISRWIIDPNRAPLLDMNPDNPLVPGKILWHNNFLTDEPVYQEGREPTEEEIRDLTERLYFPYYNSMMGLVGSLADRRTDDQQRVLVIDGHSFPTHSSLSRFYERYGISDFEKLPLFIIGNKDGQSCDDDITEAFIKSLKENFNSLSEEQQRALLQNISSEQLIGLNQPFKGVHNVQFFGQRQQGINSFQLELNESAYMDEDRDDIYNSAYDEKRMNVLQRLIEKTCLDIDPILKQPKP